MIVSFAAARVGVTQRSGREALRGFGPSGCEWDSEDDNSASDLRMFTPRDYEFTLELQLYLCAKAILGTEGSGHCREAETKVKVWTVRPKKWPMWRGDRWWRFDCTKNHFYEPLLFAFLFRSSSETVTGTQSKETSLILQWRRDMWGFIRLHGWTIYL